MVGKAIAALLTGHRTYPLFLPQEPTLPAVTYQLISSVRQHAYGQDADVTTARVQVDCWADTYTAARTLADEVKAALSRHKGLAGGVQVLDVLLDNERELYEHETDTRRVLQDYLISYEE